MLSVSVNRLPHDAPDLRGFISLWTLSLAPLIAHVVVGVPQQVYITNKRPNAMLRFVHLNPTSILWRYFAILDRRIRAKHWDPATLATSNAIFWTDRGWDGAEHVLEEHRTFLLRSPAHTHVQILSSSFIQTLIVAFQGVQALLQFSNVSGTHHGFSTHFSKLAIIFQPLAVFGLFRLIVAYWLVDDFAFANTGDDVLSRQQYQGSQIGSMVDTKDEQREKTAFPGVEKAEVATAEREILMTHRHTASTDHANVANLDIKHTTSTQTSNSSVEAANVQVYPISSWRAILFRVIFLLLILGITALSTIYLVLATRSNTNVSATSICMVTIYPFFTIVTAIIFSFNMFRDSSRTTIVPGLSSIWYQVYTCVLFGAFAIMFIIASLEQVQPPCDGSGNNCKNIATLDDARVFFNVSFTNGQPSLQGFVNVSHVLMTGIYSGFLAAQSGSDVSNHSIGLLEVL